MAIKLLAFDYDDTLISKRARFVRKFSELYSKIKKMPEDKIYDLFSTTYNKVWDKTYDSLDKMYDDQNIIFLRELKIKPSEKEILIIKNALTKAEEVFKRGEELFPNVRSTLKELKKNYIIVLLTGSTVKNIKNQKQVTREKIIKRKKLVLNTLEKLSILAYFDKVYFPIERAVRKPHPDSFGMIFEDYPNIRYEESLMIGDSHADIVASRVKMRTAWFTGKGYPEDLSEFEPEIIFDDFKHLPELIRIIA